jgi:hypothetical protein
MLDCVRVASSTSDPAGVHVTPAGPQNRRRGRRAPVAEAAALRAGDLTLHGTLSNLSEGGAYLSTRILIEVGEAGVLESCGACVDVEVVWLRGAGHDRPAGMGLIFTSDDASVRSFLDRFDVDLG